MKKKSVFTQTQFLEFLSYRAAVKENYRSFQTSHSFLNLHFSKLCKHCLCNCTILMSRVVHEETKRTSLGVLLQASGCLRYAKGDPRGFR